MLAEEYTKFSNAIAFGDAKYDENIYISLHNKILAKINKNRSAYRKEIEELTESQYIIEIKNLILTKA